jgi:solute carrier family 35, member C2
MEVSFLYWFLSAFFMLSGFAYSSLIAIEFFGARNGWSAAQLKSVTNSLLVVSISLLWYAISLSFTLYNKWILQTWNGGFHFPVSITTVHMFTKYVFTRIWAHSSLCVQSSDNGLNSPDNAASQLIPELSWKVLTTIVVPIGICTSADIVFSNIAVYRLPLSMYTTIKGSTLIFTYLLGIFCQLEPIKFSLVIAVFGIVFGLTLAVFESSTALDSVGLVCVFAATLCSALRWVLMQLLAVEDTGSHSVMVTLYRFSPYSVLTIIPFAVFLELPSLLRADVVERNGLLWEAVLFSFIGGVVSFFLLVVEVRLLRVTSSLSMCVIGQIKEVIQILVAMVMFHDHINTRSGTGIAISLCAAYAYRHIRGSEHEKLSGTGGERDREFDAAGDDDEEEDDDDEQATFQILMSSDQAHHHLQRTIGDSQMLPNTIEIGKFDDLNGNKAARQSFLGLNFSSAHAKMKSNSKDRWGGYSAVSNEEEDTKTNEFASHVRNDSANLNSTHGIADLSNSIEMTAYSSSTQSNSTS